MDEREPRRRSLARAVLITLLILLAPLLYVGSYLALVLPGGREDSRITMYLGDQPVYGLYVTRYRVDGDWPSTLFLPLELIDRQVRPGAWPADYVENGDGTLRRP